ncbi:MAG TPA: LacI family DNA-binding transcriptional regulator [Actinomycetes bacterium]|nr:LacI family DNA-binding transcriptional regulator [Actinomycetes bacterium]
MDVARRAGVSKGAVSFALNDRPGLAPQTRDRIMAAARDLGWQPSTRARALSRSRAFAVGLVMRRSPELLGADPWFPQFLAGVETTLAERGSALVLQVVGDDDAAEASSYRRLVRQGRVDGVFLNDMRIDDPRFALLASLGLPAVAVGRPAGPCPFPMVTLDDRQGVIRTVEHLLELGHRRIGFVGGTEGYVHATSRRSSWRQTLEAAGIAPGPELVADFTGPGGAAATHSLLALAHPPTAIVYANDVMAIAGMGVAIGLGLELPTDLSVAGFDDVPLAAHVTPALTTVRQDALAWGQAAADVLLAVSEGQPAPDVELPPASPVFRASTGPPRPE